MKKVLSVILILFATVSGNAQYYMNTFKNNGINYSFPLSEIDSLNFLPDNDGYILGINKSGGEYYSIYVPDIDSITYGLTSLTKDPTIEINPSYVSLDWNKIEVVNQNPDNGFYQLKLPADSPDIIPGTIFSADISGNYALNIVKSVTKVGDVITIQTVPGSLCDVFANTNLVFTTSSQQATAARAQSRSSKNTLVCTPVAIIDKDADGNTTYHSLIRTRVEITGTGELFKMNADYTNDVLWENDHCKLYFEKATFDWELDMVLSMSFGGRNLFKSIAEGTTQYFSKTLSVSSYLQGSCKTEQVLAFDVNGSYSYETENRLLKENIVERGFLFLAGEVPVLISLSADLCWDTLFKIEGGIHSYMGYVFNSGCKAGFNWDQKNGIKPIKEFSNNIDLVAPMVEGEGRIDAKASIYPHVKLLLYKVVGPTFDIKPYLDYAVDGGLKTTYGGDENDYVAWGIESYMGLDCNFGLSLALADHEIANCSTNDINILKKLLYKSPVKFDCFYNVIKVNETNSLLFKIYDKNGLLNEYVQTLIPQTLSFQGDGIINNNIAISNAGIINIDWTPLSEDDCLTVTLKNSKGDNIDIKIITPTYINGHEYVELGLSSGVKWATCNVGAFSPEESGDYYAWGETEPKNNYSVSTYKFYDYKKSNETGHTYYTKYNTYDVYSFTLHAEDDVAYVKWGEEWKIPSIRDFWDLIRNCTMSWTTFNGIYGLKFTSNISGYEGGYIFLPAAGFWVNDGGTIEGLRGVGMVPYYWTSTLFPNEWYRNSSARSFYFSGYFHPDFLQNNDLYPLIEVNDSYRERGLSIRPVIRAY